MKQVHNRLLWAAQRNAQYVDHQFVDAVLCAVCMVLAGVFLAMTI